MLNYSLIGARLLLDCSYIVAIFDCIGCIFLLLDWLTGLCLAMLSLDCSKIMDCVSMARID